MSIRIEAADNRKLKLIRKLGSKKHRDALSKFVIEGINLVEEALAKGASVDYVVASEDFDSPRLDALNERIRDLYVVPRELYEKISDAENGSGVLAVVSREYDEQAILSKLGRDDNVLVLDRVQDPGNIGTMIRTAVAAGYSAVMMIKGTADLYSPKVLRATAGMVFDLPVLFAESAAEAEKMLHDRGFRICVTEPEATVPYYEAGLSSGIALVIGNEGNGVSDEISEAADERITIPMRGSIESLNAAVAAAIVMYESIR